MCVETDGFYPRIFFFEKNYDVYKFISYKNEYNDSTLLETPFVIFRIFYYKKTIKKTYFF